MTTPIRAGPSTQISPPSLSTTDVHDLLALGEYSKALKKVKCSSSNGSSTCNGSNSSSSISSTTGATSSSEDNKRNNDIDEILLRLPNFLRLLISSQPLSSIPSLIKNPGKDANTETEKGEKEEDDEEEEKSQQQKHVDEIVSLLELIAVAYPESENMELLISHLLPKVINGRLLRDVSTSNLSSLSSSLSRKRNQFMKLSFNLNENANNSGEGDNAISTSAVSSNNATTRNTPHLRGESKNTTITVEDEDDDATQRQQQQQSSSSFPKSYTTILNPTGESYCYFDLIQTLNNNSQSSGVSNNANDNDNGSTQHKDYRVPSQCHYYVSSNWDTNNLQRIMDDYNNNMKLKRNQNHNNNNTTFSSKKKKDVKSNEKDHKEDGGDGVCITNSAGSKQNKNDQESSFDNDDDEDDDGEDDASTNPQKKKIKLSPSYSSSPSNTSNAAANPTIDAVTTTKEEDSQEYNIMKVLIELIGLIISSLRPLQLKVDNTPCILYKTISNSSAPPSDATMLNSMGDNNKTNTAATKKLNHSALSHTVKDEDDVEGAGSGGGGGPPTSSTSSDSNQTNGVALQINPDSMLTETMNNNSCGGSSNTSNIKNSTINQEEHPICATSIYSHSNLSALLTSLLHHVPTLRHEHLSNALCRATTTPSSSSSPSSGSPSIISISQCSHIIQRLAANSPSSTCTLVRGCINAYHYARLLASSSEQKTKEDGTNTTNTATVDNDTNKSNHTANTTTVQDSAKRIIQSAKESVLSIAKLSKRESSHIVTTLNQSCAMPDVMISLMMELESEDCHGNGGNVALAVLLEDLKREQSQANMSQNQTTNANSTTARSTHTESSSSYRLKRKRKYNIQNRKRKKCAISNVIKKVHDNNPWIINELKQDIILASKVRYFISSQLESILYKMSKFTTSTTAANEKNIVEKDKGYVKSVSIGRASFILRVYAALIHSIGIGSGSSPGSGSTFVQQTMDLITRICKQYQEVDRTGRVDELIKMALSACILTCIQFPPIVDGKDTFVKTPALIASTECLKCQLNWTNCMLEGFLSRTLHLIRYHCGSELKHLILDNIFDGTTRQENSSSVDKKYLNFCEWASSIVKDTEVRDIHNYIPQGTTPSNIFSLIECIRHSSTFGKEYDGTISCLLNDAEKCEELFETEGIVTMVISAASAMALRPPPMIPIVLPLTIETGVSRLVKKMNQGELEKKFCCQISLQLIYAFTFLDKMGDSPFAIKPRSLPLQTVIHFTPIGKSQASEVIQNFVIKYSPETFMRCNDNLSPHLTSSSVFHKFLKETVVTPKDLGNAIRQRLSITDPYDTLAIEQLYLYVRATQPASIVDTEVSLALLESTNDPIRFLTYTKLCQDPLMMLKCSLKVWTDEGLRRILLAILQRLLDTNEKIVKETAINTEVATEYLISRDSIILRSCLLILSDAEISENHLGYHTKVGINCPLLVSMIRSMIANRFGLVAAVIKQLDSAMLDWLVTYVPEMRSEANIFLNILERGTLPAVERLHVADAALRIAIAHGSKDETELQPLAYTALSILVNSFYIVIGPVGVPVNVLCDQNGEDTTQKCRKYLLRMLSAVKNIQEDTPKIRNESRMALSKLAGLCKNDMNLSGLTGAVAQRRKVILKELWDALVRANASLGSLDYFA